MKKANLPDYMYYHTQITTLIKSYIKQSGIKNYESITGAATNANIPVGTPDSADPSPKVLIWLTDIQDSSSISHAANKRYNTIGTKIQDVPVKYNEILGFTVEAHANKYSDCIKMAEAINKGFKPNSTLNLTYKSQALNIPCKLSQYSISVEEEQKQVTNFIASFMLALDIQSEPLEKWQIDNTKQIDNINIDQTNNLGDNTEGEEYTTTITE